jgi:hypothetical protein
MNACKAMILIAAIGCAAFAVSARAEAPAMPATPAATTDLLYARPFTLEQPAIHDWHKDKPEYTEGYLLVLEVDPALVYPRQTGMPVLYVGDTTAHVFNVGAESGRIVVLAPGKVDLSKAPIWFGTPYLPGEVDHQMASNERTKANNAGIKPYAAEKVKAANERGKSALAVEDAKDLSPEIGRLIQEYAPDEESLAATFLNRK